MTAAIVFSTVTSKSGAAASGGTALRRLSTRIVTFPEDKWRLSASNHASRILSLLSPGLTDAPKHVRRQLRQQREKMEKMEGIRDELLPWTSFGLSLDPKNPVFNFLVEYYGFKGAKGPRRLARWSPDPTLLLLEDDALADSGYQCEMKAIGTDLDGCEVGPEGAIFLEGATEADLSDVLHMKGAMPIWFCDSDSDTNTSSGVLYSPAMFYKKYDIFEDKTKKIKAAAPFQWFQSILTSTLSSEPIFHCHGLHEWAMQYHPPGADPPPSGKYQSHLPLRVSRSTINSTVERKGIHCTHVDALRFFAPAAAPLNHHGSVIERTDQLRLEQKGCVHAHMDLLKMSIRLQPFVDANLVADTLELALDARLMDVEASPYDVSTTYGLGVLPVETEEGRKEYRRRQRELASAAEPVRRRLLGAYRDFLELAFDEEVLGGALHNPARERFAYAEPGGKPWRKNLIDI